MRKRQFLFGNEIHVYLLPAQRVLLRRQIKRTPEIPGLITAEKTKILREDPYIANATLGLLADWFPDLISDMRQLEIRRQASVDINRALTSRSH